VKYHIDHIVHYCHTTTLTVNSNTCTSRTSTNFTIAHDLSLLQGSPDNIEAYTYYIKELNDYKLGWLEVMDGLSYGFHKLTRPFTLCDARKVYDYPLMGNVGYTRDVADTVIRCGAADAISFGRPYISNPDLVDKFQHDLQLSDSVGADLYYSHGPEGYADVPTAKLN
jgi:N-ethylmaleimide reductase